MNSWAGISLGSNGMVSTMIRVVFTISVVHYCYDNIGLWVLTMCNIVIMLKLKLFLIFQLGKVKAITGCDFTFNKLAFFPVT